MANLLLTSTPAADDRARIDFTRFNRGICLSEPPMPPGTQLKPVDDSDMSKLAQAHCLNDTQSRPLFSVTSTSSTVTPNVSNANVSNANVNESLAAIMSSKERIGAFQALPHVRVKLFHGLPQHYPSLGQRFKQLVETKLLDDTVR